MPGISVECWGLEKPYGSEGYGWAATLPLHIIRSLIGFREYQPDFQNSFLLCPNFPMELMIPGKNYSITNLKFQNKHFSLKYEIISGKKMRCYFDCEAKHIFKMRLINETEQVIPDIEMEAAKMDIKLEMVNEKSYRFVFLESENND